MTHKNERLNKKLFKTMNIIESYTVEIIGDGYNRVYDVDGPCTVYLKNNRKHREDDLPAVDCLNGHKEWRKHGKLHRDGDLPAVVYANGYKEWRKHGKLHRDGDLPAVVYANGDKE